jgi:uncharacterized protein YqeY
MPQIIAIPPTQRQEALPEEGKKMGIRQQLTDDLKSAMKTGDTQTRDTLRLVLAAVKQQEVDTGTTLDDDAVQGVLANQAKQRRDSIATYTSGSRVDLADVEQLELDIIERYLPRQLSRAEIETVAAAKIEALGVTDMRGMGQVMGALVSELQGTADGKLISQVVRDLLTRK